jgi:putative flavoprotein involved in K+ transport
MDEKFDTIVIGGGQAGLATAYHLKRRGVPVVIVDEQARVGDAWRTRWDSLRLFTPAWIDGLPGMPFPARASSFPTKDEMADYLEAYAERFGLPIRTGVAVERLERDGDGFQLSTTRGSLRAERVVVASGANRVPRVPAFAADLSPSILQMHSSEYRNPSQLRPGSVLLVGVGNSGAEIAAELARTHGVWLAGAPSGEIPIRHGSRASRVFFRVFTFVGHRLITRRTPIGRLALRKAEGRAAPLIRVKSKDLVAAGVERVGRVTGVRDGRPIVDDGRVLDVDHVIWCTGFRQDFPWIDLPAFDETGRPLHHRGLVPTVPGLAFVGLVGLFSLSSDVIPGSGRDAGYIAKRLADDRRRRPARTATPAAA